MLKYICLASVLAEGVLGVGFRVQGLRVVSGCGGVWGVGCVGVFNQGKSGRRS